MDKQIARANALIQQPSKNRKTPFVRSQQQKLELNQELITKRACVNKKTTTEVPFPSLSLAWQTNLADPIEWR
jgi:hypothetical protein